ncbi:hypothetical protein WSK_3211 [Novosphingobium sp. Rr 2-17]|uniref:hypothetical protein n=1 Tax=Novosphingobium sp. Rr 2-17 TaxID=555793 RepID=UPI00026988C3|nr:hypothetical protein [Novosphingobium sp. Rr 2-17]EIZ78236.1 hypothetical protein WSK_3211 [Novosphingobium sp. Rr 2-17]
MTVSKRLMVVVVVGLLAGGAFAGMTTRSIHTAISEREDASSLALKASHASDEAGTSSWVDRGIAVLTEPAAPFGEHAWNASPGEQDNAQAAYGSEDEANPDYGANDYGSQADSDYDQEREPDDGAYADRLGAEAARPAETTRRAQDAAAQAADHAQAAAQDVIAAEGAH